MAGIVWRWMMAVAAQITAVTVMTGKIIVVVLVVTRRHFSVDGIDPRNTMACHVLMIVERGNRNLEQEGQKCRKAD